MKMGFLKMKFAFLRQIMQLGHRIFGKRVKEMLEHFEEFNIIDSLDYLF